MISQGGESIYRQRLSIYLLVISQLFLNPALAVNGDTGPVELATANDKLNRAYKKTDDSFSKKTARSRKTRSASGFLCETLIAKWVSPAEPLDCMIDRTDRRDDELSASMFNASNGKYTSLELQ